MGKIVTQILSLGIWSSRKNFFPNVGLAVEMAADIVHMVMRMYHTVNLRRGLIQHFMFEAKQTVMQNDKYINDNI